MADRSSRTSYSSFLLLVSLAIFFGQLPLTWAKNKGKQTSVEREALSVDPVDSLPVTLVGSVDFITPLDPPVSGKEDGLGLCYQVNGPSGRFYNLLYDSCLAVNAEYITQNISNSEASGTFVKRVGILAHKSGKKRQHVLIEHTSECRVVANGNEVHRKYNNGVSIAKRDNSVSMVLTTCTGARVHLEAECTVLMGVAVVKLSLTSASSSEKFHGLMGQFINVPVSYKPYTHGNAERMYTVRVNRPGSTPRVFLGQYHPQQWDGLRRPCLYAGSTHGGTYNFELEFGMGTSVIEGAFMDYEVSKLFHTDFRFANTDPEPTPINIPPVNDFIGGEGLVSVVVHTSPQPLSICFQVDGEADTVYNILSHDNLVINARYVTGKNPEEEGHDQVAILYQPSSSTSRRFFIESEGCSVTIDSELTSQTEISTSDYQMRKQGNVIEFSFKQVGNARVKTWIECAVGEGEKLLSVKFDRTSEVPSQARGLVGQFWGQSVWYKSIPPSDVKPETSEDDENVSRVLVSMFDRAKGRNSKRRQFVADKLSYRWNGEMMSCLYMGNTQGGPSRWDSGNVIRGNMEDYVRRQMFDP